MKVMVLTDRKRILVTESEEEKIVSALARPAERITVRGIPYKKTMIGYFDEPTVEELQGTQSVLKVFPGAANLDRGPQLKCRGQRSIQCEITAMALRLGGVESADNPEGTKGFMLATDTAWREKMRRKLRRGTASWCDARTGECACDQLGVA